MIDKILNNSNNMPHSFENSSNQPFTVGIIGGGVAGSTIAIRLAALGVQTYLFETKASLIDGPPMCHLHAGGNLYREIPDEDCIELLKQSVDMLRMYPYSIDVRPTIIAIPLRDDGNPEDLLPRLHLLTDVYRQMIATDPDNKVLGNPEDYFRLYQRQDLERLINPDIPLTSNTHPHETDEWVAAAARQLDLDKLKYPVVAVKEYGWNIFRLAASAHIALSHYSNAKILLNARVTSVRAQGEDSKNSCSKWQINYLKTHEKDNNFYVKPANNQPQSITVDYLINACGFRTGEIDNMVGVPAKRMVEFKASYVAFWDNSEQAKEDNRVNSSMRLPEIIIHGKRGTPNGMVQLTPYPDGFYQIHSMGKDVTLFDDGLVTTKQNDAQPKLKPTYLDYIEAGWDIEKLHERSLRAINQVSEFVPNFATAKPTNNALYGGQQIPGENDTLRVADVSLYPDMNYARAENVKASSALLAADYICDQFDKQNLLPSNAALELARQRHNWEYLQYTTKADIDKLSKTLALERNFPQAMSKVVTSHDNV